MYCRKCGSEVESFGAPCSKCGFLPLYGSSYCQECGYITKEGQLICTSCEQRLKFAPNNSSQTYHSYQTKNYQDLDDYLDMDKPNTGANVAACCSVPFTGGLPIVGFVLYLVWKDEKPNAAKSVCMWSLIPFIAIVGFYLLFFVFGIIGSLSPY